MLIPTSVIEAYRTHFAGGATVGQAERLLRDELSERATLHDGVRGRQEHGRLTIPGRFQLVTVETPYGVVATRLRPCPSDNPTRRAVLRERGD